MSDESTAGWLPPGRQPAPPPLTPAPLAPDQPAPDPASFTPAPADDDGRDGDDVPAGDGGNGRSRKVLIGGVIGVLAIGAAGVFAVSQMAGDNRGGAANPEELGEAVMESIAQEDFLGVIDLLLPGERATFGESLSEMVAELQRLEVVGDGASLKGIDGFDVALDERSVDVATTNVADIANITMTADATVTVDGDELPVGELLTDNFGDVFGEIEGVEETESGLEFSLPVTAVEQDGRWYVSGMYAIAEEARQGAGFDEIPAEGIVPHGGGSPEGAVDVLLDGVEQLDLAAIIGAINPNEAEALQRYAPLFLGEAQGALDEIPLSMEFTDLEYEVSGSDSTRSVIVSAAHLAGEFRDPSGESSETVPFTLDYADGCYRGETQGESIDTCTGGEPGDLADVEDLLAEFGADEAFAELRAIWEDVLSDYEQPGVTVKEVDGEWYVSPIATGFDQLFAVTNALDRDELERAADAIAEAASSINEVYTDGLDDLGDVATNTTTDTGSGSASGDATGPDDDVDAADPYSECLQSTTAEAAAGCFRSAIDAGALEEASMPVELEFLECGTGDVLIGLTPDYAMTDEEYTVLITTANECFTALIASGAVDESRVPDEYLHPECAEGRNPWRFDSGDDEFFNRWLDCIYQ